MPRYAHQARELRKEASEQEHPNGRRAASPGAHLRRACQPRLGQDAAS